MLKPIINKLQSLSKSTNRKYDAFSLMVLSILGIIIVCVFNMIFSGTIRTSFNDVVEIVFSSFLVLITYLYTSFTKDILEDGKKKREIEFIQRQLEYFYNPWLQILEEAKIVASKNVDPMEACQDYNAYYFREMEPILRKGYYESYNYHYLADKEIWKKNKRY